MIKEGNIGLFDSGVGGLNIFLAVKKALPREDLLYLADSINMPYGKKTSNEIKNIALKNTKFLLKKNCKLIVIACNTATVSAIKFLRNKFPFISFVGVVPVLKPAVEVSKTGHIVLLSTALTKKSSALKELINKFGKRQKVYNLSCPDLVETMEKEGLNNKKIENLLKRSLQQPLKDLSVDTIAVGCTHYSFLKKIINTLFVNKINFIEPSKAVAKQVKSIFGKKRRLSYKNFGENFFYTTGDSAIFNQLVKKFIGLNVKSQKVII